MPRKPKKLPSVPALGGGDQAQSTWALAHSYELAARVLRADAKPASTLPVLFLLLHSLELSFKAFLLSHGATERELRAAGHDLLACMKACKAKGLGEHLEIKRAAVVQVIRVNRYYADKELEYFVPRAKNFGSIDTLHETVCTVAKAVLEIVCGKAFGAIYHPATEPCVVRTGSPPVELER